MSSRKIDIVTWFLPEWETPNPKSGQHVEKEFDAFRFSSVLAQLEIWSCFRGEEEPLFKVVTPIIEALKPE